MLLRLLRKIPYLPLVAIALLLALAPFFPVPHLLEKIRLLFQGELTRPLDIFDLFYHLLPLLLLLLKGADDLRRRRKSR